LKDEIMNRLANTEKGIYRFKWVWLLIALLGTTTAMASAPVEAQPPWNSVLPGTASAAEASQLWEVKALTGDQVSFGQALNIAMTVTNASGADARNVHLLCRADPGGYFMVEVVDQPYVVRDENNQDVSLDEFAPGWQKDVNFSIQAPMSQLIPGEWSRNFHFNFFVSVDGGPEMSVGTITLTARQGRILVQKSGFAK
jgi:hypothetical protein